MSVSNIPPVHEKQWQDPQDVRRNKVSDIAQKILKRSPAGVTKALSKITRVSKTGTTLIISTMGELCFRIGQKIRSFFNTIFSRTIYIEKGKFLRGKIKIDSSRFFWHLNCALLRDAMEAATTSEQKQQIRFLAAQYLSKSAPIRLKLIKLINRKLTKDFQAIDTLSFSYHRGSLSLFTKIFEKFNKDLPLGNKSPFIPTDTDQFEHLFPLKFTVIDPKNFEEMRAIFESHFQKGDRPWKIDLEKPLLFDLTQLLKGDLKNEKEFITKYEEFKKNLDSYIDSLSKELISNNPALRKHKGEVKNFIKKSITSVCRVQWGEISGIKVLPLFSKLQGTKLLKRNQHLMEFIEETGILMGAVHMRRHAPEAYGIDEDIRYAVPVIPREKTTEEIQEKPTKSEFKNLSLFTRLTTLFSTADEIAKSKIEEIGQSEKVKILSTKPHIVLLGKATMDLLNGLMEEITEEKWNRLYQDPVRGPVLHASLFKIRNFLATAELSTENYAKFAQEIELAHCEIATLLELFLPFEEGSFEETCKEKLGASLAPTELVSFFRAGLGKTSVNICAGINEAVLRQKPDAQRVYSTGFYYEQAALSGSQNFDEIIENPDAPKVDLHFGQSNPGIEVTADTTEYKRRDIAADVRQLLEKDKAAEHLTVGVDCTIDSLYSSDIRNLLEEFKDKIQEGRLNFIFFRSGQKLDQMGMDCYYGAPFYMVNNAGEQWKNFDTLLNHPVHQADILSQQWFCLSTKYAADSLEKYRQLIFDNTRYVLDRIPENLRPGKKNKQQIRINTIANDIKATFLDLKVTGPSHQGRSAVFLGMLYQMFEEKGIKLFTRGSFGFYHINSTVFQVNAIKEASTTRINPGLNPEENDALLEYLEVLAQ